MIQCYLTNRNQYFCLYEGEKKIVSYLDIAKSSIKTFNLDARRSISSLTLSSSLDDGRCSRPLECAQNTNEYVEDVDILKWQNYRSIKFLAQTKAYCI